MELHEPHGQPLARGPQALSRALDSGRARPEACSCSGQQQLLPPATNPRAESLRGSEDQTSIPSLSAPSWLANAADHSLCTGRSDTAATPRSPLAGSAHARGQNMPSVTRDSPQRRQLVPEGPSVTYLGMNNGVRIVQPDVVIDEDVVNTRIVGVDPQGLPSPGREPISGPPERASRTRSTRGRERATDLGYRQARLRCRLRAASEPGHGMETVLSLCPLLPPGRHFAVR